MFLALLCNILVCCCKINVPVLCEYFFSVVTERMLTANKEIHVCYSFILCHFDFALMYSKTLHIVRFIWLARDTKRSLHPGSRHTLLLPEEATWGDLALASQRNDTPTEVPLKSDVSYYPLATAGLDRTCLNQSCPLQRCASQMLS